MRVPLRGASILFLSWIYILSPILLSAFSGIALRAPSTSEPPRSAPLMPLDAMDAITPASMHLALNGFDLSAMCLRTPSSHLLLRASSSVPQPVCVAHSRPSCHISRSPLVFWMLDLELWQPPPTLSPATIRHNPRLSLPWQPDVMGSEHDADGFCCCKRTRSCPEGKIARDYPREASLIYFLSNFPYFHLPFF